MSVLWLTLGGCHRSLTQECQTQSWLRSPQAGSRPLWEIPSPAGGGSHSPPAQWDCRSQTNESCNLPMKNSKNQSQSLRKGRGQQPSIFKKQAYCFSECVFVTNLSNMAGHPFVLIRLSATSAERWPTFS